jgi:glycosyltransferase involved in cell wall biosynthesis
MSRPVKLLLVTDEMEAGGTQRQISLLARGLDRTRFSPEVAYFRNRSFLVDELEQAGVPVTLVPKRGRIDPAFLHNLRRLIRGGGYGILHAFSITGELWSAVASSLGSAPPLIVSVRGRYEWYSPLQWRVKAWAARRACCIVANSAAGAAYAADKMRLPPERIRVVRNGVDPARGPGRGVLRAELGLSDDALVGLFLGRLVGIKNVESLLRAVARVSRSREGFVLLVAGGGPLRATLERLARELDIASHTRFLGERKDAGALLEACDFLVLPSRQEGLSNVLLESMALDRAVVASDVPGNREVVTDGVNGLVYPSGDNAALAHAIVRLIDDEPLRKRLGAAGGILARSEFSVSSMVRSMEAVYTECLPL